MMTNDDYRHFVCIVAGDNPKELMAPYDKNLKGEPQVVYKYKDTERIKNDYIKYYQEILDNPINDEYDKKMLSETLDELKEMSNDDFYAQLTIGLNIDEDTWDAYTTENINGKWASYQIGKVFCIPFLTKDGREVFQAKKGEIDWSKIHLHGGQIYERAWEMIIDGSIPENDYEQQIFDNMKGKEAYFQKFETKENYVTSNTAFWGYAFVSDKTGWQEADETNNQFVWMSNYYDLFIKNLSEDTLLTIYECTK